MLDKPLWHNRAKFVARAGGPGRMLIYGLGNLPYPKSRHSVGQLIIDGLAARFGVKLQYESKIQSFHGEATGLEMPGSPNNKRLKLSFAKSKHYMNISGPSVKQTYEQKLHNTQTFHPRNRRLIVIHDSIYHQPFKISPRFGGSPNGHNGVRSVIAALGTEDFHRIRIGVGSPAHSRGVLEQFVLEKLSKDELEYWSPGGEGIERVWETIVKIIEKEIEVGREERESDPTKGLYLSNPKRAIPGSRPQKQQRSNRHSHHQQQTSQVSPFGETSEPPNGQTQTSQVEVTSFDRIPHNESNDSHELQKRIEATKEAEATSLGPKDTTS